MRSGSVVGSFMHHGAARRHNRILDLQPWLDESLDLPMGDRVESGDLLRVRSCKSNDLLLILHVHRHENNHLRSVYFMRAGHYSGDTRVMRITQDDVDTTKFWLDLGWTK